MHIHTVQMDNLVNGCCAAAVAYSSAGCTCALDVFATSSSSFFRPGSGAMAASRDVRAMERLSNYLLTLCGVKKSGNEPQGTQRLATTSSSLTSSSSSTTTTDAVAEVLRGSAGAGGGGAGCVGTSAMMAAMGHLLREEEASLVSSSSPSLSTAASSAPSISSSTTAGGSGGTDGGVDDAMIEWVLQQVAAQSSPSTSGDAGTAGPGPYPAPISPSSSSSTSSPLDGLPPDAVKNAVSEEASAVGEASGGAMSMVGNAGEGDGGVDNPGMTYDAFLLWLQGGTSGDGEFSRSPPAPPPSEALLFSKDALNASVEVLQQSVAGQDEEQREGGLNTSTAADNSTNTNLSAFQKPDAGTVETNTGAPTSPVINTAAEKIDGSTAAETFVPATDENDLSTSAAGAPPALSTSSTSSEGGPHQERKGVEETYLSEEYQQGTGHSPRKGLRRLRAAGIVHITHIVLHRDHKLKTLKKKLRSFNCIVQFRLPCIAFEAIISLPPNQPFLSPAATVTYHAYICQIIPSYIMSDACLCLHVQTRKM